MSDTIFIKGLVIHAYHGVLEHEQRVGQTFVVDLALDLDLAAAARSDKLADTISYQDVVSAAEQAFTGRRCRLVETAAGAVAEAVLKSFARVARVKVTVKKPHAPIAAVFEHVGVSIVRTREGR